MGDFLEQDVTATAAATQSGPPAPDLRAEVAEALLPGLGDMPQDVLLEVLRFLPLQALLATAAVSRRLRQLCADPYVWRGLFARTFGLPLAALGPDGCRGPPRLALDGEWLAPDRPTWYPGELEPDGYRAAFRAWWLVLRSRPGPEAGVVDPVAGAAASQGSAGVDGALEVPLELAERHVRWGREEAVMAARADSAFHHLRAALVREAPGLLQYLRQGASADAIAAYEARTGVVLPPAARAIWAAHDGQTRDLIGDDRRRYTWRCNGLFGSLAFYTMQQSWFFLSLQDSAALGLQHQLAEQDAPLAALAAGNMGIIAIDCTTGGVVMLTANAPRAIAPVAEPGLACLFPRDGCMRWLETYAAKLETGYFSTRNCAEDTDCRYISLFPAAGPLLRTAVTNGVEIMVSTAHAGYVRRSVSAPHQRMHPYSIRMRLLPGGTGVAHDSTGLTRTGTRMHRLTGTPPRAETHTHALTATHANTHKLAPIYQKMYDCRHYSHHCCYHHRCHRLCHQRVVRPPVA